MERGEGQTVGLARDAASAARRHGRRSFRVGAAATAMVLAASPAPARNEAPAPARSEARLSGTIRSWGHGYLAGMMRLWEEGFRRHHPDVTFDDRLVSSAAAIAGLYSDRADIGVLAREIIPPEVAAYEKMTRQKLFPVDVLTGSVGNQDKIMAIGIFVNAANPIARLDFPQLDAIFGAEHRGGGAANIRAWGELGLPGAWRDRPVDPYSGLAFEAPAQFFSQKVMAGSVLWNERLKQFANDEDDKARYVDAYQQVVDAVGRDPAGIGMAGVGYRNDQVKLVAVAQSPQGPFVDPDAATIASRTYPLARPVRFYINDSPAKPASPLVRAFMRYVLSPEGQALVAREGDFLPVPRARAEEELRRLR